MQSHKLDARRIFQSRVLISDAFRLASKEEHPTTVFVGAQPGAGKSRAIAAMGSWYPQGFLPIVGDDFRRFHPQFNQLVADEPLRMPEVTAELSGELVALSIDHANEQGYSCTIEGTWRDSQLVVDSIETAKAHGRKTHAVAVCVHPLVSMVSTMYRFYGEADPTMARWTPPEHHLLCVKRLRGTLEELASCPTVDRYTALNRSGQVLYDGPNGRDWLIAHSQAWTSITPDEADFIRKALPIIADEMARRPSLWPPGLSVKDFILRYSGVVSQDGARLLESLMPGVSDHIETLPDRLGGRYVHHA